MFAGNGEFREHSKGFGRNLGILLRMFAGNADKRKLSEGCGGRRRNAVSEECDREGLFVAEGEGALVAVLVEGGVLDGPPGVAGADEGGDGCAECSGAVTVDEGDA